MPLFGGGGLLSGVTKLGGGLVNGVSGLLGGVSGAASGLAGTVLNSPAGTVAAGSLSGLTGGSSVNLNTLGNVFTKNAPTPEPGSTNPLVKATFFNRLLNMYKLKTPPTLKGNDGVEYLNYEFDNTGGKQIDWIKVAMTIAGVGLIIWGVKKLFFSPKKSARRMSRKSRGMKRYR